MPFPIARLISIRKLDSGQKLFLRTLDKLLAYAIMMVTDN